MFTQPLSAMRIILHGSSLLAIALALSSAEFQPQNPTATLSQGVIIGTTTRLRAIPTSTVNKFLGIPFAESPPKRFEPPKPVAESNDTVVAQKWKPKCIETVAFPPLSDTLPESEDCLYVNVYAPANATGAAVLFWIYGGALQFGNAGQPLYDGSSFAAFQGVIVVSANYRTNLFGFSNSPDLPLTSRNAGFLDQRLALRWTQENIAIFGGDPEKVTIFGQSSGASSVDRFLTAPPSGKLPFRAAILQSGQASVSPLENPIGPEQWKLVVSGVGCLGEHELSCMQKVNASAIKSTISNLGLRFLPQNDGVTQKPTPLLVRDVIQTTKVPILIGNNGNEAALYIAPLLQRAQPLNSTNVQNLLNATLGPTLAPVIEKIIRPTLNRSVGVVFQTLVQALTDLVYKCPASLVTDASVLANIPTWRYLFNATFPDTQYAIANPVIPNIGAFHASEISLVFGTYDVYRRFASVATNEEALSKFIQTAWADFAKNPTNGPGWTAASKGQAIECLGCTQNLTGGTKISSSFYDRSCVIYNNLYVSDMPMF